LSSRTANWNIERVRLIGSSKKGYFTYRVPTIDPLPNCQQGEAYHSGIRFGKNLVWEKVPA
jgi:hypothetical protein